MNQLSVRLRELIPLAASTVLFFVLELNHITDLGLSLAAAFLLELIILAHLILRRIDALREDVSGASIITGLGEIVVSFRTAVSGGGRFKRTIAESLKQDFASQIGHLAKGQQTLSPDRFMALARVIYGLMGRGDRLIATSLFAGGDYWKERYGADYLKLNREAAGRGAEIDRIFIVRDEEHLKTVAPILALQKTFAQVYYCSVAANDLTEEEQRDFFVINEDLAAEFHFTPTHILTRIDLITDPDDVRVLRTLIVRVRDQRATKFVGSTA